MNRLENNARREKSLTRLIDEQYPIVASTLQAYGLPVPENPENYCIGSERGTICAAINERSEIKERVAALQLELKEASPQYRRGLLFALGTGIGMFAGMAYLVWQKHKNDIAEESERASNYKAV
ncbi:hypothetical protein HYU12_03445 [Candidatus Woesearchaeota archaeon]|nr:hypothetical protein [Candidatus Woesearchaeota archaeon]